MGKKLILGIMTLFLLSLSSCYPELSVQQYDQLKADLKTLYTQRQDMLHQIYTLKDQVSTLQQENAALTDQVNGAKSNDANILDYINFLSKLVATQSSELILKVQFDVTALVNAKASLITAAAPLGNGDVDYYLSLIDPDKEGQTAGAYYKVIETCVKAIKANLNQ